MLTLGKRSIAFVMSGDLKAVDGLDVVRNQSSKIVVIVLVEIEKREMIPISVLPMLTAGVKSVT